jgi:hypothetical protein
MECIRLSPPDIDVVYLLSVKYHRTRGEVILAACDSELLGMRFVDGEKRIEVYRSFYDGYEIREEELGEHLSKATIANLVGERSVQAAVELGYISPSRILLIGKVPHAQFALLFK